MDPLHGKDLFGEPVRVVRAPVADRFLFPPFSVLDARQGEWIERKRAWRALGIRSEVGRSTPVYNTHASKAAMDGRDAYDTDGTSIFDPVLCELVYRWFSVEGDQIVDPFAGGSVRGIVAGMLGRRYWGADIRQEQVDANVVQGQEIRPPVAPEWVCGDSMDLLDTAPDADLVFSCPPYGDLEVYSDLPGDISSMEYHTFIAAYRRIIRRAIKRLREDRFACFVVGDFRDRAGFYRNFVSHTIEAFELSGARLYNEAVLVTSVGTGAMRVTKQFNASRKLVKIHQNVLVFCKGNSQTAARRCVPGSHR